jgi:hypothetical protein
MVVRNTREWPIGTRRVPRGAVACSLDVECQPGACWRVGVLAQPRIRSAAVIASPSPAQPSPTPSIADPAATAHCDGCDYTTLAIHDHSCAHTTTAKPSHTPPAAIHR